MVLFWTSSIKAFADPSNHWPRRHQTALVCYLFEKKYILHGISFGSFRDEINDVKSIGQVRSQVLLRMNRGSKICSRRRKSADHYLTVSEFLLLEGSKLNKIISSMGGY